MLSKPGYLFISLLLLLQCISSCEKEKFTDSSEAMLSVSADTLRFDTVFVTTGSVTQLIKIYNTNEQSLRIGEIRLMGGNNSAFQININGIAAPLVEQTEIAPNDSMYIFVTVSIQPNNQSQPFLINDSIHLTWNGNEKWIQLEAYGQNAHYLSNHTISGQETWNNDLPYVILHPLTIDTGARLDIGPGCKIYCHADAPFIVKGTLRISGEKNNEVIFRGDRLDTYYRDLPASWPGIYFQPESNDNYIRFAKLLNAYQAVYINGDINTGNQLTIEQTIIYNAYKEGLTARKCSANVSNSLISNCGQGVSLTGGGHYQFTHCTIATYSNSFLLHNSPSVLISNYEIDNGNISSADLTAKFINCICWGEGSTDNEIETRKEGNTVYMVEWKNSLYKATSDPANTLFTDVIRNEDPQFDSIDINHQYYDFRTTRSAAAPGNDRGIITSYPKDLDELPRLSGTFPDLGCYEKQ